VSISYDPYDWDTQGDPYPVYRELRRGAPAYRNGERDFWALSRHGDVTAALRDPGTFSSRNGIFLDPSQWGPQARKAVSFLAADPPDHTRLRGLVASAFTRRRVAALEPRIRELTRARLAPLAEQEDFDFAADFAAVVPMEVICELTGVPEADREDGSPDMGPAARDAGRWLRAYYRDLVASRRGAPGDDLTSALIQTQADAEQLGDEEIVSVLHLLVAAGNESTGHLLTNAWQQGAADPCAGQAGRAGLAAPWAAETLRYDSSSQWVARTVMAPVRLHGTVIPEGARVLLLLGAANRDEAVFADPDRYDLGRPDARHAVSFGGGPHYCLGAPLASLQIRVVLEELGAVIAGYEVDTSAGERSHWPNVRGWTALPTRVTLRPRRPPDGA
jgi:cytochrome P450